MVEVAGDKQKTVDNCFLRRKSPKQEAIGEGLPSTRGDYATGPGTSLKQLITVLTDAPEENNEYAEPQTCEGDGIRRYFRAVGEPWFEDMAGFSAELNILMLFAVG